MRKLFAAAIVLTALGAAGYGHADPVPLTGTIALGNASQTAGEGGITENGAPCELGSELNGLDGVWLDVSGLEGLDAVLTFSGENAAVSDADVYFYSAECSKLEDDSMAQNFIAAGRAPFETNVESGSIPEDAAFAIVNGFFGANISFTLTVG